MPPAPQHEKKTPRRSIPVCVPNYCRKLPCFAPNGTTYPANRTLRWPSLVALAEEESVKCGCLSPWPHPQSRTEPYFAAVVIIVAHQRKERRACKCLSVHIFSASRIFSLPNSDGVGTRNSPPRPTVLVLAGALSTTRCINGVLQPVFKESILTKLVLTIRKIYS